MKWEYLEMKEEEILSYAKKNNLSKFMATMLLKKGFNDEKAMQNYLNSNIDHLNDPYLFEEMEEAVNKILKYREEKKKVFIYGDYDVDGITATAFLTIILRKIGMDIDYYIPSRLDEGYGLNNKAIKEIQKMDGELIITVDIGVNSDKELQYAKENNIEVIITDHHKEVKDEKINIKINPKTSENYPFKYLSGVGVALKLAQGIYMKLGLELEGLYEYLDVVMLGTVADVVPLVDENRIIVKKGLEYLENSKIKGFKYLFKYLRLNRKKITTSDISFNISPMLNALGRIKNSKIGVDFFIEEDEFTIYNIIEEMKKSNKKRRKLEKIILDEIMEEVGEEINEKKYLFLYSSNWHPGVIGVVASRLALKYNIPVFLISLKNKEGKGSCRSTNGINIFELLKKQSKYFVRFGGHDFAAGFTTEIENLEKIENGIANEMDVLENKAPQKETKIGIDIKLNFEEINEKLLLDLEKLAPFGANNTQPIFYTKNVCIERLKEFGVNKNHFKGFVCQGETKFYMVGFNLNEKLKVKKENNYEIIYYLEIVNYRTKKIVQLKIKDIK